VSKDAEPEAEQRHIDRAEPDQAPTSVSAPEVVFPASRNDERLEKVEKEVLALRAELDDLKRQLGG
jgi:hypothetical protein